MGLPIYVPYSEVSEGLFVCLFFETRYEINGKIYIYNMVLLYKCTLVLRVFSVDTHFMIYDTYSI